MLWSEWRASDPKPGEDWETGEADITKALSYTGPPVDEGNPQQRQDMFEHLVARREEADASIRRYRDDLVSAQQALGLGGVIDIDGIDQALRAVQRADGGLISRVAPDLPS